MIKKIMLVLILVLCLCSCGKISESEEDNTIKQTEDYKTIENAGKKLKETYKDYIITNTLEEPYGSSYYLTIVHDGVSYTEVSVSSETNELGKENPEEETEEFEILYSLCDWTTSDGKFYSIGSDEDGKSAIFKYPDDYYSKVQNRDVMKIDTILNGVTSIESIEDFTINTSNGIETLKGYRLTISPESVKDILDDQSLDTYVSVLNSTKSEAVKEICNAEIEELNDQLTFSKGLVVVGINNDGILKYVSLGTGGLGSRLYFTTTVASTTLDNVREFPDTSEAINYEDSWKSLVEAIEKYGSYDEFLKAMETEDDNILSSSGITLDEDEITEGGTVVNINE